MTLTDNDLYYLRTIGRRLVEYRKSLGDVDGLSLGILALADEIEWLDCFIDQHERAART